MTFLGAFNLLAFLMLIISMVDFILNTTGRETEMIKIFIIFPTFCFATIAPTIFNLSCTGSFILNFAVGGFLSLFLFYFFYALLSISFIFHQYMQQKQQEEKGNKWI